MAIDNYIEYLKSEIASRVYSEGEGVSFEDKFTEYCTEILEELGKSEGARVLSYIQPDSQGKVDWKINGYSLKDEIQENNKTYFETIDLYISLFKSDEYEFNITKDVFTKSLNQIKKFINDSIKGFINYIDPSKTELIELIKIIKKQSNETDRINIYFLTNGICKNDTEKTIINGQKDLDVFIHIWDINRFFKIYESSSVREPIDIKFENIFKFNEVGLPCLKVPEIDPSFECYLAIIPGYILAEIYNEYSSELLESNVRAFLGQKGKYNKAIKETIIKKPQMFLPYNNGISATADCAETLLKDGQLLLTRLIDFQVVNGGQTTASIFHTQKKNKDTDISKIFVQMKLTVIKEKEKKNEEVPNISRFANSQNKVSDLDLSSNNPFFVQIEKLSRKKYVINPINRNQSILWFFERVNGQYNELINKQVGEQNKRKIRELNPVSNKFIKSDIAKFINIWELEPYHVSMGKEKNFVQFTKKISEAVKKEVVFGENFYKKLIANAILFKTTDKLFGRKNLDAIGDTDIKSFIVAYTLSFFHYLTDNRLDLWKIYENQVVPEIIVQTLRELQIFVYGNLIESSKGKLFSEHAKKVSTWEFLKSIKYEINLDLDSEYFVSKENKEIRGKEKEADTNEIESSLLLISDIISLGLKFWDGLKIYSAANEDSEINYIKVLELFSNLKSGKNLTNADILTGSIVINKIQLAPEFIEECKILSKLEDIEMPNVKIIYDKIKLVLEKDWKRILDIGKQTSIFDPLELNNLKSISSIVLKNEKPKEQALIKAFDSIKKLKKFGIKI